MYRVQWIECDRLSEIGRVEVYEVFLSVLWYEFQQALSNITMRVYDA
jgi:hypothetical protein